MMVVAVRVAGVEFPFLPVIEYCLIQMIWSMSGPT